MAEDAAKIELPQRVAKARPRLAPFIFGRFMSNDSAVDNPTPLTQPEVQGKCFAVLGYLEEYHGSSVLDKVEGEDVGTNKKGGLKQLEQQLDKILHPALDEKTGQSADITHHEQIRKKLSELLAYPQVRERFESEFNQELPHYQAARRSMREVRDIDRVTEKLRLAIYGRYLDSKQQHGKLTQSAADQIGLFQGKLNELELQRTGIEETASPSAVGYLETQKLLDYKKQLKENGFVITPSRKGLLERIRSGVLSGKKIFLVGSTGTGKSELAFYAFNKMTGGYELIPWHEGSTPRDVHGMPKISIDPKTGQSYSHVEPGPYPRAKETGHGLIHGEVTGAPTRVLLELKDTVFKDNNIFQLFTGNPKDERTKQREDMDPAILRELTGVEVSYMLAPEMDDIIRAMLIEENGVLKLSKSEVDYVETLSKAAEMMQRIHNRDFDGFSPEMKNLLGIDAQGNTETTLNTNFLDPGTLFKLFGEWELAQARGQNFADYMEAKLGEFIKDPKTLSAPEERKTLQKVLHTFGLITNSTADVRVIIENQEKGYILPSEMAGQTALSNKNPMDHPDAGVMEGESGLSASEQIAKEILGKDFLGRDAIKILEDRFISIGVNVKFLLDKLPPFAYTEQDLQLAKENGEAFFLRPEEMTINGKKVPVTINALRELFKKDPLGKLNNVFNNQTWYDTEKFATQLEIDGVKQINLGSALVKKGVLDGSTGKTWGQQEEILKRYRDDLSKKRASNANVRRRTAIEATWDSLLYYVNTGERLLSDKADWGQTLASDGYPVCVGDFDSGGWNVGSHFSDGSNPYFGTCSSR